MNFITKLFTKTAYRRVKLIADSNFYANGSDLTPTKIEAKQTNNCNVPYGILGQAAPLSQPLINPIMLYTIESKRYEFLKTLDYKPKIECKYADKKFEGYRDIAFTSGWFGHQLFAVLKEKDAINFEEQFGETK